MNKKLKLTDERPFFRPFNYPWAYDAFLKSEQSRWLFTEVPLNEDVKDWNTKLSATEKQFLTHIFRFFTQADLDVAGGYVKNYLPHFPQPEIRMMLLSFASREAIHIGAYSHLIETVGLPDTTYNEFMQYKEMRDKHDYFLEFLGKDAQHIAQQIAAFSAFTEGLQLFSSFIMLLNFARHGKMKGMGQIITWSIVDETLHTETMIKLFRTFIEENKKIWKDELKKQIYTIAEKMVELEFQFIDLAFSMGPMEGLTADDVKAYVKYIAGRRLIALGLKNIFKVKKNPLTWVEEVINAPTHTNFFENQSTDYSVGALTGSWDSVWAQVKLEPIMWRKVDVMEDNGIVMKEIISAWLKVWENNEGIGGVYHPYVPLTVTKAIPEYGLCLEKVLPSLIWDGPGCSPFKGPSIDYMAITREMCGG